MTAEGREMLNNIKEKLESLPYERTDIKVFGAARINVHVKCKSINTANKWASILAQSLKAKAKIVDSYDEKTRQKVKLVSCIA